MRAALARTTAVLMMIGIAAAACGDDAADPAVTSSPSPSAAASPSAAVSPSASAADAQVELCANLNGFATAAGPAFDLGVLALIDGETPNERRDLSGLIDSIAVHGAFLQQHVPADLADDVRTVVDAAAQAKTRLAKGAPADEAAELLRTEKVKAAREAVVAYRGSC